MAADEEVAREATPPSMSAQFCLGNIYMNGEEGVTPDLRLATELFRKSAAQGDYTAMYQLACCYFYGDGVPQDQARGQVSLESSHVLRDTRKLADADDGKGLHELAMIYAQGTFSVKQHPRQAMVYLRKSAEVGYLPAMRHLGDVYANGDLGERVDYARAGEWLGKAGTFLDSDFSLAALCVAGGHGTEPDLRRARDLFVQCARRGHEGAAASLREFIRRCRVCAALDTRFKCSACRARDTARSNASGGGSACSWCFIFR
jgi:TPR repeat protein